MMDDQILTQLTTQEGLPITRRTAPFPVIRNPWLRWPVPQLQHLHSPTLMLCSSYTELCTIPYMCFLFYTHATHSPWTAPWVSSYSFQESAQASPYETLSEFSSRTGFHTLVPKSYFYMPHHECEGMKWPGAEERLLRLWQMMQMVWEDVVKGSCGLELGSACRELDIFKVSMVLPISS